MIVTSPSWYDTGFRALQRTVSVQYVAPGLSAMLNLDVTSGLHAGRSATWLLDADSFKSAAG